MQELIKIHLNFLKLINISLITINIDFYLPLGRAVFKNIADDSAIIRLVVPKQQQKYSVFYGK